MINVSLKFNMRPLNAPAPNRRVRFQAAVFVSPAARPIRRLCSYLRTIRGEGTPTFFENLHKFNGANDVIENEINKFSGNLVFLTPLINPRWNHREKLYRFHSMTVYIL